MKHALIVLTCAFIFSPVSRGDDFPIGKTTPNFAVASYKPRYPDEARKKGVEGEVKVRLLVGIDGSVESASIIFSEPPGVFDEASLTAARQWRFYSMCGNQFDQTFSVVIPFAFKITDKAASYPSKKLAPSNPIHYPPMEIAVDADGQNEIRSKASCSQ